MAIILSESLILTLDVKLSKISTLHQISTWISSNPSHRPYLRPQPVHPLLHPWRQKEKTATWCLANTASFLLIRLTRTVGIGERDLARPRPTGFAASGMARASDVWLLVVLTDITVAMVLITRTSLSNASNASTSNVRTVDKCRLPGQSCLHALWAGWWSVVSLMVPRK